MKVITIMTHRGGAGKTTESVNLAVGLAMRGHRVLAIDIDPQGHASRWLLKKKTPAFYDLMVRQAKWDKVLLPAVSDLFPDGKCSGLLYVVGGNGETNNVAGSPDVYLDTLKARLYEIESHVDYVIMDTNPTRVNLHDNIFFATDYLVTPSEPEIFGYDGVSSVIYDRGIKVRDQYEKLMNIQHAGIVLSKYVARTVNDRKAYTALKKHYGDLVWRPVPASIKFREMVNKGTTFYKEYPDSPYARVFWSHVEKVEQLGVSNA